jgi:predicted RNase H-like HicB family nuclease
MSITFHVAIEQDEADWFVVECPALPGCVSQGKTRGEAIENIKDAILGWLAVEDEKAFLERKRELPQTSMVAVAVDNN